MGVDVAGVLHAAGVREGATAVAASARASRPVSWAQGALPASAAADGNSVMYAASVTKQVIAVLAARAVLAGRLSAHTAVAEVLPGPPGMSAWISQARFVDLVHHSAVLPSTAQLASALEVDEGDLDDQRVLAALATYPAPDPAVRAGGARFAYNNTGYVLLAQVLAAVEGVDVPALAHRELFAPLGMTRTHLGGPPAVVLPGLPTPPGTIGDGGLWTSAEDLRTWLVALNQQRWGQPLEDLVTTPGRLRDGTAIEYAWGVRVRALAGGTWVTHGGNWPGWAAKTVRVPDQQVAVAVVHCGPHVQAVSDAAEALTRTLIAD